MKVAIVHDFLVRFWGAEKLVQTFSEMFPEAPIFTLFYNEKKMWKFFPREKIRTSSLQKIYNWSFWRYTHLLPWMPSAIEEFDFSEFDLVLSSSAAFSHWIITNPETKHVCYVHAPMRWAWDYFFKYPKEKNFSPLKKFFFERTTSKIREWDFISASRPDVLLAASKDVQKRIKKFWRRDSKVVYPFVELEKFKEKGERKKVKGKLEKTKNPLPFTLYSSYYLVVSQLVPYKKIDQIIKAFNLFSSLSNKWEKLVIVWEWQEREKLEKMANSNIEFVWPKYWEELVSFYQNAKAFVFAWIDDFWITPIEALACWVPVIALEEGWVKETVVEWKTWFFYQGQSSDSILNCLKKSDLSKIKSENCRARTVEFSKEKFVKEVRQLCY